MPLRKPTADSTLITQAAVTGLQAIYVPGYKYAKAGVMLLDLQDGLVQQFELAIDEAPQDRSQLMAALDKLNQRYGRGTLALGSSSVGSAPRNWRMKQERKTPAYTTRWEDLVIARA